MITINLPDPHANDTHVSLWLNHIPSDASTGYIIPISLFPHALARLWQLSIDKFVRFEVSLGDENLFAEQDPEMCQQFNTDVTFDAALDSWVRDLD